MDELWKIGEAEGDDGDLQEFTDALGTTRHERMRAMPPRDMREYGLTPNTRRLDAHTGVQTWASKGGDVESVDDFDTDRRDRAAEAFAQASRTVIAPRISMHRNGTQEMSERDAFLSRGDMYHGYNEHIPRGMKTLIPTRRGATSMDVTGHERRHSTVTAPSVPVDVAPSLKTDAYNPQGTTHRVAARGDDRVTVHPDSTHMGAHGLTALRTTGVVTPANYATIPLAPIPPPMRTGEGDTGDAMRRVTHLRGNATARRGGAELSQHDSVTTVVRGSTVVVSEHPAAAAHVPLRNADSTATPGARRLTFDQTAAAAAAQVDLASHDSTSNIGWDVQRTHHDSAAARGDVTMRRTGPAAARPGPRVHDSEYTRALVSARARDQRGDSARVERVVADLLTSRQLSLAASHHARALRADSIRTRDATRTHNTLLHRALQSVRRLMDDTTEFTMPTAASHIGVHQPTPVAEHRLADADDVDGRTGPQVFAHGGPVHSTNARKWADDGSTSRSRVPLAAGATKHAASSVSDRGGMGVRSTETPTPRPAVMTHASRPPSVGFERRGRRE